MSTKSVRRSDPHNFATDWRSNLDGTLGVEADAAVDEFLRTVPRTYEDATGLHSQTSVCAAEEGVRVL